MEGLRAEKGWGLGDGKAPWLQEEGDGSMFTQLLLTQGDRAIQATP